MSIGYPVDLAKQSWRKKRAPIFVGAFPFRKGIGLFVAALIAAGSAFSAGWTLVAAAAGGCFLLLFAGFLDQSFA